MKNEFNLYDFWDLIKRNIAKILTFMFVGLGISGIITFFMITPEYSSQTQLIAQLPKENQELGNGVNNNLMMINTYKDLVKSNLVIDSAVDELNDKYNYHMSNSSLNKAISVSQEQNSQMFTIKAVADSPQKAKNMANVVAGVFQKKALKVMKVDKISVTSKAIENLKPVSPNNTVNLLIGALVGLIIGLIVIVISSFRDTTIKNEDWIVDNLGITILGSIPEMNTKELSVRIQQKSEENQQNEEIKNYQAIDSQEQRRHRRRV